MSLEPMLLVKMITEFMKLILLHLLSKTLPIVQHLQHNVEDIRMRRFHFVKQNSSRASFLWHRSTVPPPSIPAMHQASA